MAELHDLDEDELLAIFEGAGQEMELGTCTCLPVSIATCSIAPVSLSTSHPAKIATYIGLIALTVLGLTIAVTLYYIVIRSLEKIIKVGVFVAIKQLFSSVHFQMSYECSSQVFIFESVKSIKGRPVAIAGGMCYVFIWQMVLSGKMGR